mmetsp:Transcript_33873/g.69868  ORF Transcript_33873/g.69868 Transcript_33873/m.69868 type:complete len:223 (-) Transcript_33873:161-829(-)
MALQYFAGVGKRSLRRDGGLSPRVALQSQAGDLLERRAVPPIPAGPVGAMLHGEIDKGIPLRGSQDAIGDCSTHQLGEDCPTALQQDSHDILLLTLCQRPFQKFHGSWLVQKVGVKEERHHELEREVSAKDHMTVLAPARPGGDGEVHQLATLGHSAELDEAAQQLPEGLNRPESPELGHGPLDRSHAGRRAQALGFRQTFQQSCKGSLAPVGSDLYLLAQV